MIEKYFPHSSMSEFMSKLNEETLDGTYTMRLTPSKMQINATKCEATSDDVMSFLEELSTNGKVKKILAFREQGTKVGLHYHIRLVTEFKSRKSISDLVKLNFIIPKGKGRGNEAYAVRCCKEKDKTVWKSATYIAKEGDCCFRKGYTLADVNYFIQYGRKLSTFKGLPKYEQIIIMYGLDKISQMSLQGKIIYDSVIGFHKSKKLEIPPGHRIHNLIHNICFKLSDNYRNAMKESICNGYDQKLLGNFEYF